MSMREQIPPLWSAAVTAEFYPDDLWHGRSECGEILSRLVLGLSDGRVLYSMPCGATRFIKRKSFLEWTTWTQARLVARHPRYVR